MRAWSTGKGGVADVVALVDVAGEVACGESDDGHSSFAHIMAAAVAITAKTAHKILTGRSIRGGRGRTGVMRIDSWKLGPYLDALSGSRSGPLIDGGSADATRRRRRRGFGKDAAAAARPRRTLAPS